MGMAVSATERRALTTFQQLGQGYKMPVKKSEMSQVLHWEWKRGHLQKTEELFSLRKWKEEERRKRKEAEKAKKLKKKCLREKKADSIISCAPAKRSDGEIKEEMTKKLEEHCPRQHRHLKVGPKKYRGFHRTRKKKRPWNDFI